MKEQKYIQSSSTLDTTGYTTPKPRFELESTEFFNDDLIIRMIEGMRGSLECSNYEYISSREKDGGRKGQFNGLTRMLSKAKNAERLFIRNHKLYIAGTHHYLLLLTTIIISTLFQSRDNCNRYHH